MNIYDDNNPNVDHEVLYRLLRLKISDQKTLNLLRTIIKCKAYLRYGDDFVIFENDKNILYEIKTQGTDFIENSLKLQLHPKNNLIMEPPNGLKFLGAILYPSGRTLNKRNRRRIKDKLNVTNASSYWGVITKHGNIKRRREYQWNIMSRI